MTPPPSVRLPLILASASPQRQALLRRLGVRFEARPVDAAELDRGDPEEVALANALSKARAARVADRAEAVIGCDTVVAHGGEIYGKPADERAARATLRALSGETHEVISGLALALPEGERTATARTAVSFRELNEDLLAWYLALGEWRGRAGGYAIQGAGAALVRCIEGDYENVVGLPLATLLDLYPGLLLPRRL